LTCPKRLSRKCAGFWRPTCPTGARCGCLVPGSANLLIGVVKSLTPKEREPKPFSHHNTKTKDSFSVLNRGFRVERGFFVTLCLRVISSQMFLCAFHVCAFVEPHCTLKTAVEHPNHGFPFRRARRPPSQKLSIFRGRKRFPGPPISRLAQSNPSPQRRGNQNRFRAIRQEQKTCFRSSTAVFRLTEMHQGMRNTALHFCSKIPICYFPGKN